MRGIIYRIRLCLGLGKWRQLEGGQSCSFVRGRFYRMRGRDKAQPEGYALETAHEARLGGVRNIWSGMSWFATDQFEEFM